jgi:rubrerythrin
MKLSEMHTEVTPQKINKVMESRFGFKVDYDNLSYAKAQRLSGAIKESMNAIRKSYGSYTAQQNPKYMELMLVKEGLDRWMSSDQGLFESEMGRSEAVLAAKDIVDSVQDMLEKISKIQNEQVPALIDTIRDQIGTQQAEQFKSSISPMLTDLYSALSTAREASDTSVRALAGEDVGMSTDMAMPGMGAGVDTGFDAGASDFDADLGGEMSDADAFGATDAAVGGDEDLGRERRGVAENRRRMRIEGRAEMPSSTVKSVYYPDKAQSPIKKSRFAYDAQGETNFKKYPDQTSRPAGMNPDPASRYAMGEEGGIPTTPKQKRFAALADPENRMTQADRIAGAKKR